MLGYLLVAKGGQLPIKRENPTTRSMCLSHITKVMVGAQWPQWKDYRASRQGGKEYVKGQTAGEVYPETGCFSIVTLEGTSEQIYNFYCPDDENRKQWLHFLLVVCNRNEAHRHKFPQDYAK